MARAILNIIVVNASMHEEQSGWGRGAGGRGVYRELWCPFGGCLKTPDNSNLQGKLKKVRVIEGKIIKEMT